MAYSRGSVYSSYARDTRFRVDWNIASQNAETNKSVISWFCYLENGNWWYNNAIRVENLYVAGSNVFNGTWSNYTTVGTFLLGSGSVTVSHNYIGDFKLDISISGWFFEDGSPTGSGSWWLTPIPRAATVTHAPDFVSSENPTMSFNNPGGFAIDGAIEIITEKGGDAIFAVRRASLPNFGSYTFVLTDEERENLIKAIPSNSANWWHVRFVVSTNIGGETHWKWLDKTITIAENVVPTISEVFVSEALSRIEEQFGHGNYIQGKSKLNAASSGKASIGAEVSRWEHTIDGVKHMGDAVNGISLVSSGEVAMKTKLTDTRGRIATKTTTIHVIPYSPPRVSGVRGTRVNETGEEDDQGSGLKIDGSYNCTQIAIGGKVKNPISIFVETQQDDGEWVNLCNPWHPENNSGSFARLGNLVLSPDKTYKIRCRMTDFFAEDVELDDVSTAYVIMSISSDGYGVAVGKRSEKRGLEIAMDADFSGVVGGVGILDYCFPVGTIYESTKIAQPNKLFGGNWGAVEGRDNAWERLPEED